MAVGLLPAISLNYPLFKFLTGYQKAFTVA